MLRAQLRRRVPAPDVYLRDDVGCGLASCDACAGGPLNGAATHVVLPTAETLAFFLEFIGAASGAACGDVLVLRSALAAAARHRLVRRSRELNAFVASASKPHQRIAVLEDVFHRGASALCDQLVGGLASERLASELASEAPCGVVAATDAGMPPPPPPPPPPAPASHDAPGHPPMCEVDDGDDLLASLLADVDMTGAQPPPPPVSHAPAVAPQELATAAPPLTQLPRFVSQEHRLQCRSVAAAVWLAQHWRVGRPAGATTSPLVVLLVPDDAPPLAPTTTVDALTALAYAAADADPGLVVDRARAGACLASAAPRAGGGVAVLTLSQYLARIAPQLSVAARTLHPQSTSLALRGGDGAAVTRHDEGAKLSQLAATLAALADVRATALARAAVSRVQVGSAQAGDSSTNGSSSSGSSGSGSSSSVGASVLAGSPTTSLYPPHCTEAQVSAWLRQGYRPAQSQGAHATRLVRGIFKRRRQLGSQGGFVAVGMGGTANSSGSGGGDAGASAGGGIPALRSVTLLGPVECNRALEGDLVMVELIPAPSPLGAASSTPRAELFDDDADPADRGMLTLSSAREDGGTHDVDDGRGGADASGAPSISGNHSQLPPPPARSTPAGGIHGTGAVAYGRVICILRRRSAPIVATVAAALASPTGDTLAPADDPTAARQSVESLPRRTQWVLVTPMDVRLPRIRLRSVQVERLAGHRILVAVDSWRESSAHPDGHYVSTIGRALDVDTEVRCVMLNTNVHTHTRPFPPAAVLCLPVLPASGRWSVAWDRAQRLLRLLAATSASADGAALLLPLLGQQQQTTTASPAPQQLLSPADRAAVIAHALAAGRDRRDLRWSHDVCSVDPPGCTDIDDALHARELEPATAGRARHIEVGVHIADVTCFVADGSPLDLEARARGTTVYLVDRRLDMLPKALSENVCSLRARVDRYAFSVVWELEETEDGGGGAPAVRAYRVVPGRTWVGRTIIRSTHALTYYQAKRLVAGGAADEDGGVAALALAAIASASAAGSNDDGSAASSAGDPLARDLSVGLPLAPGPACAREHVCALDPSRSTPDAVARLAREGRLYPADPPEGGVCGSPVHPDDHARLRVSLTLLTHVSRWLARARGVAGSLDFERGEMRFVLHTPAGSSAPTTVAGNGAGARVMGASGVAASDGAVDDVALPADELVGAGGGGAYDDTAGGGGVGSDASASPPGPPAPTEPVVAEVTTKYQEEIHNTIAEMMIFANQAAAKLCVSAFPSHALLRHHPPADASRFGELQAAAAAAGFTVDTSSNGALQRSLHAIVTALAAQRGASSAAVSPQAALLRQTALWAMTRAAYFATTSGDSFSAPDQHALSPAGWVRTPGGAYVPGLMDVTGPEGLWHYGLAVDVYTHFTSPIRRYADDVVHKLLAAALELPSSDAGIVTTALLGVRHAHGGGEGGGGGGAGVGARSSARQAAAGGPQEPRPLPVSSTPSVAGLIDWSLGDRPALATIADAITVTAPSAEEMAVGGMDLLDSLLLEQDMGGGSVDRGSSFLDSDPVPAPLPDHGLDTTTRPPFEHDALETLASHLNERNQAAKVAGWECDELFLALYLRTRVVVTEAVVSEVALEEGGGGEGAAAASGAASVHVYVPRFQCAAPLHLTLPPSTSRHSSPGLTTSPAAAATSWALPPALFAHPPATRVHTAVIDEPTATRTDLPPWTSVVLAKLSPADGAALLREGALRAPTPHATSAVHGTTLTVRDAATGGSCTLAVMDRVCVAVTCDFDVRHARRPRIIVELLAETPGVRALLAQQQQQQQQQQPPPPQPAQGAASAPAGTPATPASTGAGAYSLGAATTAAVGASAAPTVPSSLYTHAAVARELAAAACAATLPSLVDDGGRDRRRQGAKSAPAGSRGRSGAATVASCAQAVRGGDRAIARGRGWYGGYEPPPALQPQDWHEGQGGEQPFYTPPASSASASSRLEFLGASIGWQAPPSAGAAGARGAPADPARPGPRWAAGPDPAAAGGGGDGGRVVFGGAPLDTAYVGRLHGATEATAYKSKSGAGMASSDLLGSYGGLQSAARTAMMRDLKRSAERKHDRIDKAKRAEKKGK